MSCYFEDLSAYSREATGRVRLSTNFVVVPADATLKPLSVSGLAQG